MRTKNTSNGVRHTAGPWQVAAYGCSPDWYAAKAGAFSVATQIKTELDARLIAAAPEMLAALEVCLEYFNSVPEREVGPSSEAYQAVEKVIAKALGGAV
jgi:hypothetical protein